MKHQEFIINGRRLLELADILYNYSPDFELSKSWYELYKKIAFFDAYFGYGKTNIEVLSKPINFLKEKLTPIIVHDFMFTVEIPEHPNYYLRPITILETRSLIHSLKWILYQLGYRKSSKNEIINYLEAYYPHELSSPDYNFVISLFFRRIAGAKSFSDLIDFDTHGIDQFLTIISTICWYALQAPPPANQLSLDVSSPAIRLIYATKVFGQNFHKECSDLLNGRETEINLESFFTEVDRIFGKNRVYQNGPRFTSIDEILEVSLKAIRHVRSLNTSNNSNTIKEHFNYIFNIQEHQIKKQLSNGYCSVKGVPINGNPLFGISDEVDAEQLLPRAYIPKNEVLSWFKFREDFIYKSVLKPKKVIENIQNMFGNLERSYDLSEINKEHWMTLPIRYALVNNKRFPVMIVVGTDYLPTINSINSVIVHKVTNYALNIHSFLHIELLVEGTGRYRRFNVIICPFKIRNDPSYRNTIEQLIEQTYEPLTRQYGARKAQILLVEDNFPKIVEDQSLTLEQINDKIVESGSFWCSIETNLIAIANSYFQLQSLADELDRSYKLEYCPFCSDI